MLNNLHLTNIKGFKSADMELRGLTVLSGLNSSGKSTILQALALLRQSHEAGFLAETGWLLNGPLVELGTGADLLHEENDIPELEIRFEEDDVQQAWRVAYSRDGDVLELSNRGSPHSFGGVLFSDRFSISPRGSRKSSNRLREIQTRREPRQISGSPGRVHGPFPSFLPRYAGGSRAFGTPLRVTRRPDCLAK
jgi:hypothetical protein